MNNDFESLLDPTAVYFLGAGSSWDAGLPLGNEASLAIIRSIFNSIGQSDRFAEFEGSAWPRFEVVMSTVADYLPELSQPILETFCSLPVGPTYAVLASVLPSAHLWLTTNFDDQLHQAFATVGVRVRTISTRVQIATINDQATAEHTVVKLHGDSTSPNLQKDLGVGIEQILRRFPKSCVDAVVGASQGRPLVVVGYGYRDPDLMEALRTLVANAPSVNWITNGPVDARIATLLKVARNYAIFGEGALAAFCTVAGRSLPVVHRDIVPWAARVMNVIKLHDATKLRLIAARLLLLEGDSERRNVAREFVHSLSSESNLEIASHAFAIESELLLQEADLDTARSDVFLSKLDHFLRNVSALPMPIAVRTALAGAGFCHRTGRLPRAHQILSECLKWPLSDADRCRLMAATSVIGMYIGTERIVEAEELLHKAISLAIDCNEPVLEAEARQCMGILFMRTNRLQATEPIVNEIGEPRRSAIWKINLAECQRHLRQYQHALALNEQLIIVAEAADDAELNMNALVNRGLCLVSLGRLNEAHESFSRSLVVSERLPGEARGNALYNLGWIQLLASAFRTAYMRFLNAHDAFESAGIRERQAAATAMMGWCALSVGDVEQADRIMQYTQSNGLIPHGAHSEDYDRLIFARRELDPTRIAWNDIVARFYAEPESLVHLVRFILAHYRKTISCHDKLMASALLLEGAIRSNMSPLVASAAEYIVDEFAAGEIGEHAGTLETVRSMADQRVIAEMVSLRERDSVPPDWPTFPR